MNKTGQLLFSLWYHFTAAGVKDDEGLSNKKVISLVWWLLQALLAAGFQRSVKLSGKGPLKTERKCTCCCLCFFSFKHLIDGEKTARKAAGSREVKRLNSHRSVWQKGLTLLVCGRTIQPISVVSRERERLWCAAVTKTGSLCELVNNGGSSSVEADSWETQLEPNWGPSLKEVY